MNESASPKSARDPSTRRRRVLFAATFMLLLFGMAAINAMARHEGAWRPVDIVRISGLLALAVVVALRSTTSLRFGPRNPELDDELSRANRASAALFGFWAIMAVTVLAFVGAMTGHAVFAETAPYLPVIGAAVAGLRFTMLEARGE